MNTLHLLPLRAGGARPRVAASAERGWDAMNLGRRAGGSQSPCLSTRPAKNQRPVAACFGVSPLLALRAHLRHLLSVASPPENPPPSPVPPGSGLQPTSVGRRSSAQAPATGDKHSCVVGPSCVERRSVPCLGCGGCWGPRVGGGGARLETEASVAPGTRVCEVAVRGPREPRAGPLRLAAEPGSRPA